MILPPYLCLKLRAESFKRFLSYNLRKNSFSSRIGLSCLIVILAFATSAWAQSITVVSPKGSTAEKPLDSTGGSRMHLKFSVSDPSALSKVRIVAYAGIAAKDGDYEVKGTGEQKVVLNLLRGTNKITLFGYSGAASSISEASSPQASIFITCSDAECGTDNELIVKDKEATSTTTGSASGGASGEGNIVIKSPSGSVNKGPVASLITVKGGIKKITVAVYDKDENRVDKKVLDVTPLEGSLGIVSTELKLVKEQNTIRAFDPSKPDDQAVLVLTCTGGEKCGEASAEAPLITIDNPKSGTVEKTSFRDVYLTVAKHPTEPIHKIKYFVIKNGKTVVNADEVDEVTLDYTDDKAKAVVPIKFVEGDNVVTFFDVDKQTNSDRQAILNIKCEGSKCATDFLIATVPTNSMNTRAVVGMEQVGASSAASETKPFLDFFFTNSILFDTVKDKDNKEIKVPRLGTWGHIKFSTTPQQTASAAVFPSNFVNQVTDPTKVVDLVQSFDYLAGVEARMFSGNGLNWTLIPGIKQRSRFFFTFGGGAISPLNPTRAAAQIFKIPGADSPQRAEFELRFGVPPANKTYVGFVPLERDRFFRQYYFGLRVKSHYCDNEECNQFKNSFPAILDFGFGQNEAVTGGTFKQDGKRAWVVRLDAFYPLPFRPADFLYLYGTALMKIGQGGPRIDVPLFLDTAPGEIQITSNDVFIPPADQQPSRLNRDYYKIGIGINLTDLFNRNKTRPQ